MNKIKKFISALCAVLLFVCCLAPFVYADNRNVIVYYAMHSSSAYAYHKTASCSSLSRSDVGSMTLEEAASQGYKACKKCKPPAPDFEVTATPRPSSSGNSSYAYGGSSSSGSSGSGSNYYYHYYPSGSGSSGSGSSGYHYSAGSSYGSQSGSFGTNGIVFVAVFFIIIVFFVMLASMKEDTPKPRTMPVSAPYHVNQRLYFWDKKQFKVGMLVVLKANMRRFDFAYEGKIFRNVSYTASNGKMYTSPDAVKPLLPKNVYYELNAKNDFLSSIE